MARLHPSQWDAIRRLWEGSPKGGFSWLTAAGGGAFAVSRESIRRRCQAEGWEKRPIASPGGDGRGCAGGSAADAVEGLFDAAFDLPSLAPGPDLEAARDEMLIRHRLDWVRARRLTSEAVAERSGDACRRVEALVKLLRQLQAGEAAAYQLDAAQLDPDAMTEEEIEAAMRGKRPRRP
jgi:hypothetical protein